MDKSQNEFLSVSITLDLPFRWSAGRYLSKCFTELRDNGRLVGNRCPQCKRVLLPPKVVCPICHVKADGDWVELSGKGTLIDYAIVAEGMMDPSTGKIATKPYPLGSILLDEGAVMLHYLEETDPEKLKVGMRVQAVLKPREERVGAPWDILYFRTIPE